MGEGARAKVTQVKERRKEERGKRKEGGGGKREGRGGRGERRGYVSTPSLLLTECLCPHSKNRVEV